MPDFTPAPVSTTTSAPSAFIFLTVAGVAATRGSAGSASAGTAIFMMPPVRGAVWQVGSDEEIGHQSEQDNQENDAPLGHRDEHRVGGFVLGIIVAVRRRVFDLTVVGHLDSPPNAAGGELAQLAGKGNGAQCRRFQAADASVRPAFAIAAACRLPTSASENFSIASLKSTEKMSRASRCRTAPPRPIAARSMNTNSRGTRTRPCVFRP